MGRLTRNLEGEIAMFFLQQRGKLVTVSEWKDANSTSSRVSEFCQKCSKCLASCPVVSLGEINKDLKDSGLFAVGLINIQVYDNCPIVKEF